MDRARRVGEFWNYLPTFRLVAELESASGAARVLGLTPSGVSRSIGALEASIGQPLFHRAGRELVLNDAGAHLLTAVRTAMRGVDEGLSALRGGRLVGPVRISACEPFSTCVVPALCAELRARYPGVVPILTWVPQERVVGALLDGSTDLALTLSSPTRRPDDLAIRRIASCRTSIYAPAGHPLRPSRALAPSTFAKEEFVATNNEGGAWPIESPRVVRAQADDLAGAARIAVATGLLVVLPDVFVASTPTIGLARLASNLPRPISLYGVWRGSFAERSRAEVALDIAASIWTGLEGAQHPGKGIAQDAASD